MHLYMNDDGAFYKRRPGSSQRYVVALPSGATFIRGVRPDAVLIPGQDRILILGPYDVPLVWDIRRQRLWVAGIAAPSVAPTLAAGAAAAINGTAIAKYSFAEIRNGVVIHESNLSPASSAVSLVNQGRSWSGFETTHANARVTHIRLYVSMDGDAYLHVANLALGTSTYSESTLTQSLDPLSAHTNRKGVPPYAKFGTYFHRRLVTSDGTDSFNYAEIDEPESFVSTSEGKTNDGRHITCLRGMTDELVVGTRKSIQRLQGFGISDFKLETTTQDIGIISHHGSKVINDKLWLASQDGYYRYASGGFQHVMPKLRTYFRTAYEANPAAYEDLVADVDRRKHYFLVLVPGEEAAARTAFFYAAFYLPSETSLGGGGELPDWTFDTTSKYIRTIAALTDGDLSDRLYSGACDGYVRLEGVDNTNDDGTAINWYLIHGHRYMGAQDGDDQHAKTAEYIDLFLNSPNAAVTASIFAGDDGAATAASAQWARTIAASAETKGNRTGVPKTGHRRQVIDCSGHGFSVKVGGTGTSGEYRGFALEWRNEGEQTRGSV